MITLRFVREAKITSDIIAWFSQGHVSHCEALLNNQALGSYEKRVGTIPSGVQNRPLGYRDWVAEVLFDLPATPAQEMRWESFLRRQLGKPYDWEVIGAFVLGRDWRARDSWICSELQAAALEEAEIVPKLFLSANKITPVALALALSAVKGTQIRILK